MGNTGSKNRTSAASSVAPLLSDPAAKPATSGCVLPRAPSLLDLPDLAMNADHDGPREVIVSSFAGDEGSHETRKPPPPSSEHIQDISQPEPARSNLRHLSELLDPMLLMKDERAVRSPSGNMLGRASLEQREDRPLSMRERQERVRQQILALGSSKDLQDAKVAQDIKEEILEARKAHDSMLAREAKKTRSCLGCCGR